MRAFSLVGLLVTVCIGLLIFAKYETKSLDTQKQIKPQVEQIAGRGANGEDAGRSISYQADYKGNELRGLVVKTIEAGGPMEKYYGLKVNDEITKIGDQDMAIFNDDTGASIQQYGYSMNKPLTVLRDRQTIVLPTGANAGGHGQLPDALKHLQIPGQQ